MYQAFADEVDTTITAEKWLEEFTADLVKGTA
jgi:hypothetical protein